MRKPNPLVFEITGKIDGISTALRTVRKVLDEGKADAENFEATINATFDQLGGGAAQGAVAAEKALARLFNQARRGAESLKAETGNELASRLFDTGAAEEKIRQLNIQVEGYRQAAQATLAVAKAEGNLDTQSKQLAASFLANARAAEVQAQALTQNVDLFRKVQTQVSATSATEQAAARAQAIELDQLRAKYNPIYAAIQRYRGEVVAIKSAHEQGALSAREMASAISTERRATLSSIGALKARSEALKANVGLSGQLRSGAQQLSYQVNDIAVGFAAGTPALTIFAQQGGQVVQALQLMTNGTKGFLGVLAGPWGLVISSALIILAPFVGKLFETEDAVKKVTAAKTADEIATASLAEATQILDGITGRLKETLEQTRVKVVLETQAKLDNQRATLAAAEANLAYSKSLLAAQQARASGPGQGNELAALGLAGRSATIEKQAAVVKKLGDEIAASEKAIAFALKPSRGFQLFSQKRFPGGAKEPEKAARGPSADTLARRAESARIGQLNDDTAFATQERQLRRKLLEATRKTTGSEEARDQLIRDDINAEADATKTKIANDLSAKKLDAAQAKRLSELNEASRLQRLQNVDLERASAKLREELDVKVESLDSQLAMAQIEADLADTSFKRRDVELRILDLQEQRERAIAEAVLADKLASEAEKASAQRRLSEIDAQRGARREQVKQRYTPQRYKERLDELVGTSEALNASLLRVKDDGLQSLEDGLVGVISGTKSVGAAFKDMANQIIADLIRIAVQKLILSSIGGGGSFLGIFGLAEGGKIEGFAGGGRVIRGPGTGTSDSVLGMVNGRKPIAVSNGESINTAEATANYWPFIEAMNAGKLPRFASGGLVSPQLPSIRSGAGRASAAMESSAVSVTINAPGATAETVTMIRREIANAAPALISAASSTTKRQLSRRTL